MKINTDEIDEINRQWLEWEMEIEARQQANGLSRDITTVVEETTGISEYVHVLGNGDVRVEYTADDTYTYTLPEIRFEEDWFEKGQRIGRQMALEGE